MDSIAIDPPIVVEPIDQTRELFDLADWLPGQYPSAIAPLDGRAEPRRLPVIEW